MHCRSELQFRYDTCNYSYIIFKKNAGKEAVREFLLDYLELKRSRRKKMIGI